MAIGTGTTVQEAEYSWFQSHASGIATNADLDTAKRAYFISVVGEQAKDEGVEELEKRWLRSLTGVTSYPYLDEMWREAVIGAGLPAANDTLENKLIYFKNVT